MSDDSVTIPLLPEDDTETILEKVRRSGAKKVNLIVPPGTKALQMLGGFTMLRKACDLTGIEVTVYSTDEKTVDMAKVCRFEVVRLDQETRPREVPPPEEELPRILVTPRPPEPIGVAAAAPAAAAAPPGLAERLGDLSADDLALFDALETMSMTEDVELRPEVLRRPAAPAAAAPPPERAAPPRREAPPRERPARKKPSLLQTIFSPLGSALSNIVSAILGLFLNIAARVTQRKAAAVPAAAAPATPAARARSDEERRLLRSLKWRYYLGAGIGVLGFTLLLILVYTLSQPTVIVSLTPKEAEARVMDLALTIVMTDTLQPGAKAAVEGDRVIIQARPVQVEMSDRATGPATGYAIIADSPANGVVVLTNPNCDFAVFVPANTRVATPGGITFHTTQDVWVPGRVPVGTGASVGIAPVSIVADVPGSAANVDAGLITLLDDPSGGCLRVINEMPTMGGSEHEATIVTPEDMEALRQQLVDGLKERAYAELQRQVGTMEVLSGTLEIVVVQEEFSHQVGEETTNLTLSAKVRAQALVSVPGMLDEAVKKAAEQGLGGEKAGRKLGDITHGPLTGTQVGVNTWTYHTSARVPLLTVIDDALKTEIAGALSGKTPREAALVMEKYRDRIASFAISPVIDGVLGSVQVVDASQVQK